MSMSILWIVYVYVCVSMPSSWPSFSFSFVPSFSITQSIVPFSPLLNSHQNPYYNYTCKCCPVIWLTSRIIYSHIYIVPCFIRLNWGYFSFFCVLVSTFFYVPSTIIIIINIIFIVVVVKYRTVNDTT